MEQNYLMVQIKHLEEEHEAMRYNGDCLINVALEQHDRLKAGLSTIAYGKYINHDLQHAQAHTVQDTVLNLADKETVESLCSLAERLDTNDLAILTANKIVARGDIVKKHVPPSLERVEMLFAMKRNLEELLKAERAVARPSLSYLRAELRAEQRRSMKISNDMQAARNLYDIPADRPSPPTRAATAPIIGRDINDMHESSTDDDTESHSFRARRAPNARHLKAQATLESRVKTLTAVIEPIGVPGGALSPGSLPPMPDSPGRGNGSDLETITEDTPEGPKATIWGIGEGDVSGGPFMPSLSELGATEVGATPALDSSGAMGTPDRHTQPDLTRGLTQNIAPAQLELSHMGRDTHTTVTVPDATVSPRRQSPGSRRTHTTPRVDQPIGRRSALSTRSGRDSSPARARSHCGVRTSRAHTDPGMGSALPNAMYGFAHARTHTANMGASGRYSPMDLGVRSVSFNEGRPRTSTLHLRRAWTGSAASVRKVSATESLELVGAAFGAGR